MSWKSEIDELELFFKDKDIQNGIKLDNCTTIINVRLFLDASFSTLRNNDGNNNFYADLVRLRQLREIICNLENIKHK